MLGKESAVKLLLVLGLYVFDGVSRSIEVEPPSTPIDLSLESRSLMQSSQKVKNHTKQKQMRSYLSKSPLCSEGGF